MKINIKKVPASIPAVAPKVGNVYQARGGCGTTAFWVVVAVHDNRSHLLGLNRDGNIVSTASYSNSSVLDREVIGFIEGLDALALDMKWGAA